MKYPLTYIRSNNLGDALNPYLYKAIERRSPEYAPLDSSPKILACGSIAHEALPGDVIWGTGCNPDLPLKTNETTRIMALRGPLSAEIFYEHGHEDITEIYGDPFLLISGYFRFKPSKSRKVGIVPHYVDKEKMNGAYIDITNEHFKDIINQIVACEWVISSALHGIVCAEAYGIPAVWVEFSDNVAGRGFKFRDYYLGTNRLPPEPLDFRGGIDMDKALAAIKEWEPPQVDLDLLLSVCPFGWEQTDYVRWKDIGHWEERNNIIAQMCPNSSRVIEFGAGEQILRPILIDKLCSYTPLDIYRRTPDTIVCDLNASPPPDLSPYDTVIISGVLEYLYNPLQVTHYICTTPSIKTIILSYDFNQDMGQRTYNGFVINFSYDDIVAIYAPYDFRMNASAFWGSQMIIRLTRK